MKLSIISPLKTVTDKISWIEINTPKGNFVIEPGHAPIIIALTPGRKVIYEHRDGKKGSVVVNCGLAHITRDSATIILNK